MSLGLALARGPDRRARGWLARLRPRPPARARRPAAFAADLSRRLCRAVGRDPGVADPRRLGADAVAPGQPGGACEPRGPGASRLRHAAPGDPVGSARDRRRRARAGLQSRSPRHWRRAFAPRSSATRLIGGAAAIVVALVAAALALRRSAPQFRARTGVERWVMVVLFAASLIAILTTLGILLSLMFESLRFFRLYPVASFLFGTRMEPADRAPRRPGGLVGRVRLDPADVGHLLHRRDHRDGRGRSAWADERDLSHPICAAAPAVVAEADPRDPRRRSDRRLRLFRGADRRAGGARFRPVDRHQLGEQRKCARRRARHGHHDHPLHQLDGRRFHRRRAAGDARRQPRDRRDDVGDDPQGAAPRRASRA